MLSETLFLNALTDVSKVKYSTGDISGFTCDYLGNNGTMVQVTIVIKLDVIMDFRRPYLIDLG